MRHVYAKNDYTTRDYDHYYAAVDSAKAALAAYRAAKGGK